MSKRAAGICKVCRRTVPEGGRFCKDHLAAANQSDRLRSRNRRESELKSLYDTRRWREYTRPGVLARDPLCRIGILCHGMAPSTDVDHKVRAEIYIAQNGGDEMFFFDEKNLRGGCHECHAHKTALENAGQWNESLVKNALAMWGAG